MTDHAELRRVAEAATPGARYQGTDERVIVAGNGTIICTVSGAISGPSVMADAEFLCATDPKTVLALLDEIDRLRSRLEIDERIPHDGISCRDETIKALDEKCDKLKAENDALRGALQAVVDDPTWRSNDNTLWPKIIKAMDKGATQ
ncbi:TPA: ead/Ea22-like family protein [Pseudomonas aeruginosa]|nr:ead/Ea22-like family protein [Pseudomonas aeruginosa]